MLKPEQIPDEVVANAAIARWGINEPTKWEMDTCRIIIAAAINAWPGMHVHEWHRPWLGGMSGTDIILPLPEKETSDG